MPVATRQLVATFSVGLLFSLGIAAVMMRDDGAPADAATRDNPVAFTLRAYERSGATTTTASAQAARAPRRVEVPKDPYASEPIVELGRIEIPKIGLNHVTYHGITLRNIDRGPSHWPGTAMPGQVGNTVFAGHRVTHSRPFRNIDRLAPGDEITFTVEGRRSVYRVTRSEVVGPDALRIADPTPTATATLFACHPPGSARFRYVVYADLVSAS